MAAQSKFSHSQLHDKGYSELQEMLWKEPGINWNDYPEGFKRGRFIEQKNITKSLTYTHKKTGKTCTRRACTKLSRSDFGVRAA
jgi:tRNA(His) guanylyltransferase